MTDLRPEAPAEPIFDATAGMDPNDHEWFRKAVFYEVMVRTLSEDGSPASPEIVPAS